MITPITSRRGRRAQFIVPPFTYLSEWRGVASLVGEFPLNNSRPVSIQKPYSIANSYVFAVRWEDSKNGSQYRYKLWESEGLFFPVYKGEKIGVNAILEVWNRECFITASSCDNISLFTSWLSADQDCCCPSTDAGPTVMPLVPAYAYDLPPYSNCNTFCSPLKPFGSDSCCE